MKRLLCLAVLGLLAACSHLSAQVIQKTVVVVLNSHGLNGDYDKEIADCTEAIRLNPKDDTAYSNRGGAYGLKGDYDKAIADCTKAIRLNPRNHMHTSPGIWVFRKGDYDKAIADYTEAIRLSPKG